ncbi:DUF4157 domain-containing protein [uncultured Draconibacterium sp.]|uniref:eCIS core domain-containing protein n=1 Tax=uncultured Draconibacterium sp. TaxID=1573823 RepID=UPI0025DBD1C0|nr:DUF4157 domain-containing protein [uncultured Draconibacterium sp.]
MKANAIKHDAVKSSENRTPFFTNAKTDSFFASSDINSQMAVQMQSEEEKEAIQTQSIGNLQLQEEEEEVVQTQSEEEEEEEMVQPKMQSAQTGNQIQQTARTGFMGSPVAYPFFHKIQTSFGKHDISGIQSYRDSNAGNANRKMGSLAYAAGNKVAFRGAPSLHTAAHEAAHVVQQRKGVSLKSGIGRPGDSYEQHADAVADKVVQGKSAELILSTIPGNASASSGSIQFDVESGSDWLGEFWDAYVYPGHQPGTGQGLRDVGRQVRSFQRLSNRSAHEEGGQTIIDVNDRGLRGGQRLNDTEQIARPAASGPRQWTIDLTTHELFDPQPALADVIQNAIGDCYLLATLQSMASRGGGRTQLVNAVSESGNGFNVEFYRIKIVGNKALVDPNSKIRVALGRNHNPNGVQLREKTGTMTQAQARELLQNSSYASQVQAGDSFNVNWTKRIVWPWAIERAYAAVAGGFNRIEGGFSALPIMALTGETPFQVFNLTSYSLAQLASVLALLNIATDNDTIVTSWTYNTLDTIYNRSFVVDSADRRRGIRLIGNDGVTTAWIPWREIANYISDFVILDPFGPLNGRPVLTTKADHPNWIQAIINASTTPGAIISGTLSTICLGQGLLLAPAHIYSITSLSAAGAQTSNPWSILHPGLVSPAQMRKAFGRLTFKP